MIRCQFRQVALGCVFCVAKQMHNAGKAALYRVGARQLVNRHLMSSYSIGESAAEPMSGMEKAAMGQLSTG